jgi:hypothetical protein
MADISVAHDMKSPITSVRGDLEAALSTEDQCLSRELVAGACSRFTFKM